MNISKLQKTLKVADDVRNLWKQAGGMPLSQAISDLANSMNGSIIKWALCGGLAVGVHARPRGTDDIDVIISGEDGIYPFMIRTVNSFKKTRDHAIIHKSTGVEVEVLTPEFLKINPAIIQSAINKSNLVSIGSVSIPVVNRDGLVALKLCRGSYQDMADIESIIRMDGEVDLSDYPLENKSLELMETIKNKINSSTALHSTPADSGVQTEKLENTP